ncbi:arginase family protein [Vibrio sp. Vb2424]|uniref:arginase family protein n=1 Tax=Vibrio sp. Vb2424 TaxID=2816074 RepID=UPI001A8C7083|nr:arginase family protein [Vibrio sp. Vb2424]MBO0150042.1 arginase family protein [Vibrio sp. Vb2424]
MLSFFKRYKLHHTVKQPQHYPFSFMTVCEYLPPMSKGAFELADQSLENASDWLYQQHDHETAENFGHFNHDKLENGEFQEALSLSLSRHSIPVLVTNCTEAILSMLPVVVSYRDEVGVVNIGHNMNLKPTLEPRLGSAFHFALSRYQNARLFFAGVCEQETKQETWEYAEDQGCDWVTEKEFSFRHRNNVKQQIGNYLDHCDQIIISIDLGSLKTKNSLDGASEIDIQMVLRTIRQCLVAGKVRAIQLVGDRDCLVYSRQTKAILEELYQMAPLIVHAA